MRIDGGNQPKDIQTGRTERTSERGATPAQAARVGSNDAFELSRLGTAVRSLALRIAEDDAAVRAIRMQDLKRSIANGTFAPDAGRTAEAMLEHVTE